MTDNHTRAKVFAIRYARHGWSVLPVAADKRPLVGGGAHAASNDVRVIERWWSRWPDANIAVACGPASGVVVVDVDPRNGGNVSQEKIESQYEPLEWAATTVAETPSGGRHYFFRIPTIPAGKRIRAHWGDGIDVLGRGRYALVAPSTRDSGQYRWIIGNPGTVADMPDWLLRELLIDQTPAQPKYSPRTHDTAQIERARKYALAVPGAVAGQHGHAHTFLLAQKLVRGWSLDSAAALEIMREWNAQCEPRWSEAELRRKVAQAAKYGRYSKQF